MGTTSDGGAAELGGPAVRAAGTRLVGTAVGVSHEHHAGEQQAGAERETPGRHGHGSAEAARLGPLPRELPALDRLATAARHLPAAHRRRTGGTPAGGNRSGGNRTDGNWADDNWTGGNWAVALALGGTSVALAVGEAAGSGAAAARLRTALGGFLLDGHCPATALDRLDAVAARVGGAAGGSCACLTLDWTTGALSWAIAGHPPPLVVGADGTRFLSAGTGPALGVPGRRPYRAHRERLAPGTSVVLCTGGLVERRAASAAAGPALLAAAARDRHGLAPDALAGAIADAVAGGEREGDGVVVVVRYLPEPLRARVPAVPDALGAMRTRVRGWAALAGLPAELVEDLLLALGEAAANAIDHAYPAGGGDFDYEVATTATGVRAVVRDRGRWRPEPADRGHRGRGLQIIRAVARRVGFHRGDGGTTVEFDLAARPAAPRPPAT